MNEKVTDFESYGYTDLTSADDIVEEIQEYLGWDLSLVMEFLSKGTAMLAEEWNNRNPQTPDDIINFYKETENYIFDLAAWHRKPGRIYQTVSAINICKQNRIRKVLDFGCGIGQDGILFANSGFDVTLSDLPGRTFDFAKWRVERRGLIIKLVNSNELKEKYECILCFDVLEHVWEPKEIIKYLHGHLLDNGILLVTAHFYYSEIHPMHLRQNVKYMGPEFIKMMTESGFRPEPSWNSVPLVFRKINNYPGKSLGTGPSGANRRSMMVHNLAD